MKTIVISITVPDGVTVSVTGGAVPDDFEHEPLPTDTFADAEQFVGGAPVSAPPANGAPTPFRGAAMQRPAPSTAQVWQVGNVHQAGHKPLKAGRSGGLFCPSKLGEDAGGKGIWCEFRVS